MLRSVLFAMAFAAVAAPACAADAQTSPSPEIQALGRMAQECQAREASALVQVYALQAKLAAETKRADEAEAKLKADPPSDPGQH